MQIGGSFKTLKPEAHSDGQVWFSPVPPRNLTNKCFGSS